ncbi:putative elongator complex protein 4 isoform X2 [Vespa mandarinia]|nr:putative elongator complex protein 4 isoform X2 [Vespa mandarinia]XP_035726487.1 putative elongator complex protein 4 isoform X2 [Vespa mandarinia]XP_035726495.1 putative elongator complex protein 4 isoform X2 [Vespa mandarinia]XP_035726504.1 putative elongator complex protein 4 isoform X2 [Vespa mandarinia]
MAYDKSKTRKRYPQVVGTMFSRTTRQLILSTGIPFLDRKIGEGLPVGSLFLIEEDTYGTYANMIQKYFIAEGIVIRNPLLIASLDTKPSVLLSQIPNPTNSTNDYKIQAADEKLKVAWRYRKTTLFDLYGTFGHEYDLRISMNKRIIDKARITQWHGPTEKIIKNYIFENPAYEDLLETIAKTLKNGMYIHSDGLTETNMLRICINSLGSRMWFSDSEESTRADIFKFLYCLRALLKSSYATAIISIPIQNFDNSVNFVERLEHLSDITIKLESFNGSAKEINPLFKDYHGLLHIKKMPIFKTLYPYEPKTTDLGFKLLSKKFVIEELNLPPISNNTIEREQDETSATGICSAGGRKNLLDF